MNRSVNSPIPTEKNLRSFSSTTSDDEIGSLYPGKFIYFEQPTKLQTNNTIFYFYEYL